jgi:hypothetical protein
MPLAIIWTQTTDKCTITNIQYTLLHSAPVLLAGAIYSYSKHCNFNNIIWISTALRYASLWGHEVPVDVMELFEVVVLLWRAIPK